MAKGDQQREQAAADAMAALGNHTRLRIFKLLVRAGPGGANVGTIQRVLHVPPTTLAHHLGTLTNAGLVDQARRGREVICTANYKAVADVLDYVKGECCAGLESAETGMSMRHDAPRFGSMPTRTLLTLGRARRPASRDRKVRNT